MIGGCPQCGFMNCGCAYKARQSHQDLVKENQRQEALIGALRGLLADSTSRDGKLRMLARERGWTYHPVDYDLTAKFLDARGMVVGEISAYHLQRHGAEYLMEHLDVCPEGERKHGPKSFKAVVDPIMVELCQWLDIPDGSTYDHILERVREARRGYTSGESPGFLAYGTVWEEIQENPDVYYFSGKYRVKEAGPASLKILHAGHGRLTTTQEGSLWSTNLPPQANWAGWYTKSLTFEEGEELFVHLEGPNLRVSAVEIKENIF